jgi:cytochrome c-type biogenesis protein CcsB
MVNEGLASLSDGLFWGALAGYALAMVLYFASLAYRGRRTGSAATIVAWLAVATHATSVGARGLSVERVPWGNMFEYSNMIGLLVALAFLVVLDRRLGMRALGGFVIGASTLLLGTAALVYAPAERLQPALTSYWLKIHVFAAITGSMLFTLSFVFTVLFLLKQRAERRSVFGGSTVGAAYVGPPATDHDAPIEDLDAEESSERDAPGARGILGRLPSSSRLDTLAYRTVQFAFPIWTFAVIAGAIWAHEAWGRYWGWDPKETWAFVTWVVYAGYLHARSTAGWRGARAAYINVVAFASVLITYFVVNLVISGLHSYAGV